MLNKWPLGRQGAKWRFLVWEEIQKRTKKGHSHKRTAYRKTKKNGEDSQNDPPDRNVRWQWRAKAEKQVYHTEIKSLSTWSIWWKRNLSMPDNCTPQTYNISLFQANLAIQQLFVPLKLKNSTAVTHNRTTNDNYILYIKYISYYLQHKRFKIKKSPTFNLFF